MINVKIVFSLSMMVEYWPEALGRQNLSDADHWAELGS